MRLLSKNLTADKRLHLGGLLARGVLAFAIALSLSSVAWCQTTSTVDVSAGFTMNTVGPEAYGVDTAVYDGYLTATGVSTLLTQAGIGAIRYPGGSYADIFNFISGTDQTVQPGGYMASNTTFNLWMSDLVIPEGGHPIITVNYGSNLTNNSGGEPSVAASWVQYANVTNNYNIVYWEIGNEVYGNGYYSTGRGRPRGQRGALAHRLRHQRGCVCHGDEGRRSQHQGRRIPQRIQLLHRLGPGCADRPIQRAGGHWVHNRFCGPPFLSVRLGREFF
jgi:hypothetical protein